MEEEYCHILRLRAVPHMLKDDGSNFLIPLDHVSSHIQKEGFPSLLARQLEDVQSVLDQAEIVHYYTLTYQGSCFSDTTTKFVGIELLPQPYVLYNVDESKNIQESDIKYALYTLDSELSKKSSFKGVDQNIKINPNSIYDSNVHTKIDVAQKKLESNSKLQISTALPVQVFYSLMFVYYNKKIVKVLVSRNVIIFNDNTRISSFLARIALSENYEEKSACVGQVWASLANTLKRDNPGFDLSCFEQLSNELGQPLQECAKGWEHRMYYYVYVLSGKPQGDSNFGENEYRRKIDSSFDEKPRYWAFNWSTEFLNRCFQAVLDEIFDLVKEL